MKAEIDLICRVCGAVALDGFPQFARLPRVTSDCRPFPAGGRLAICGECAAVQKPVDARWREEAAAIYAAYDVYFQSGGVEQAVFDPATGAPRRRSAVLVDRLASNREIAETGTALDVGCGNGALLSAFAGIRPGWRLYGHDLSEINRAALSRIPGFEQLYTGPMDAVPGGFDLVSLSHSLEHFTNPVEALASLRSKLAAGGCLFIEVPDAAATPFDLLVADHVSHFTADDIARVLARAGFDPLILARDWVVKELSVVAEATPVRGSRPPSTCPAGSSDVIRRRVEAQIAWLQAVIDGAREAAKKRPFGVFGTSVAAMWLFGEIGDAVEFFADEDPSRRGRRLLDRPILHPGDVPAGATVYVPLIPRVAQAVAARASGSGADFRLPPAFPAV
jgi:SAM-dependent methyltransferase